MASNTGFIQNNQNTFAFFYRIVDIISVQFCLLLAVFSYPVRFEQQYIIISLVATISYIFTAEAVSIYRSWRDGSFKELFFYVTVSWAVAAISVLTYLFFTKTSIEFSRVAIAIWFALTFMVLIGWRYIFALFLRSIRKMGLNTRKVAIIGLTDGGKRLAEHILHQPETGYRLAGIYDDRSLERIDKSFHRYITGSIEQGVLSAKDNQFDAVYIALPIMAEERLKNILYLLGDTTANVQLVPDLFTNSLMKASMSHVGNIQTISVYNSPFQGANAALKRLEDIVLSLLILTVTMIPMLLIALCVKLTSSGPIIFKQHRYGLDGKQIRVWKFRTMKVTENDDKVVQAIKEDQRVTRFGRFLRRSSLDELPQLINTLLGDMSLVGPRPHAIAHNEKYRKHVDFYMLRHKVKPGITGWAQVNGWRGETETVDKMEMRIKYDLEYMRNWSLWLDFKIVILTVFTLLKNRDAY